MSEREEQWNLDCIRDNERVIGNLLEQNAALGKRLDRLKHEQAEWGEIITASVALGKTGCWIQGKLIGRLGALTDRISNLECGLRLQMERQGILVERVEKLKGETAEWIDALQGTDADLAARLDALTGLVEQETAYLDKGIELLDRRLSNIVETWVNISQVQQKREAILAHRVEKLEKWVDGTDLITSERFCALAERVAKLERPPSRPAWERDFEQHEWLRGDGAVEYDALPKDASNIAPGKSAACTCGAGDAIPQDHDEDCPKYDAAHIPF